MSETKMRTVAAIATPAAVGGIGIIRISGPDAVKIAGKVFKCADGTPLSEACGYTMKYGKIYDGSSLVDEAIALVYRAPKSYTGEDVAELSCHGGLYVLRRVLRLLTENGAYLATAGEFTKRAFLNGKIDLTEAQAVMDIISANGEQAARGAAAAKEGAVYRQIENIKKPLVKLSAHMGVWADYPDEDIPELQNEHIEVSLENAQKKLRNLLKSFDAGKIMCGGLSCAIVGKPNVGKSTLMNLMAKTEKSIVTCVAGTTRDVVEENINFGNVILKLADTAGIHSTSDEVEKIGVSRARERAESADIVLAVFDSSQELNEDDREIIAMLTGRKSIAIINKVDLNKKIDSDFIENSFCKTVYMSASTQENCQNLEKAVEELFEISDFDTSNGIINNEEQRNQCVRALECVEEALDSIRMGLTFDAVNISIDCAIDALMSLTGERITIEVTDAIFKNFCVGK